MHPVKVIYILAATVLPTYTAASSLPVIDLGYELHQAISLDQSTQAYNFSNIRYAASPADTGRFLPPRPPTQDRTEVQTGSVGRVCPQGALTWEQEIMPPFMSSVAAGTEFNASGNVDDYPIVEPPRDARITEDCLFLDVVVPKRVFDGREANASLAPVLVWIDGGGYISGDKSERDPRGLLKMGEEREVELVYVALNYRLGAFGWLADVEGEGFANAGLYDQRLALEWVREYIALFGGDPDRVTVMGQSAGGGSVIHQLAAYGGNKTEDLPFGQAIIQSPMWYPQSTEQQDSARRRFLELLNVSSIAEARGLPSSQLIAANAHQIASTPVYGTFTYGPVVDSAFAPDLPSRTVRDPSFKWKHLRIMTSHTSNEGLVFTPPAGTNSSAYQSIVEAYTPSMSPETIENISQTLYPPVYNSSSTSLGYGSPLERVSLTVNDAFFQCKNRYLNTIFDTAYASVFSVPPGLHSQDIPFTFYNHSQPDIEAGLFDEDLALTIQDHIVSFVRDGVPSSRQGTTWETYEKHGRVLGLESNNITMAPDPVDDSRCRLWWEWSG
ncbi:carboxylesterase family protein [Aspergillus heteromorphus CBS 117.55]|uniref:Carboxylic ester hydrolase n=1 Tax=Aspergillus heteromorphus CBS 117.55 TaxID=1448321 RepID=A0A317WP64_9EURO|nr:carboxylesterase family protein [Aspergillus heteromorphus CBS 117.55]PWY88284.1 carboxylesterase family protein [Aspergillus heteromorphus CBS 117.55]